MKRSEDSSSYRRQNNEMFIHELEQNSINPNRYDGHGQQDEILDDKHFLLPMSYTEGKHVPLMDSKLRHSKPAKKKSYIFWQSIWNKFRMKTSRWDSSPDLKIVKPQRKARKKEIALSQPL